MKLLFFFVLIFQLSPIVLKNSKKGKVKFLVTDASTNIPLGDCEIQEKQSDGKYKPIASTEGDGTKTIENNQGLYYYCFVKDLYRTVRDEMVTIKENDLTTKSIEMVSVSSLSLLFNKLINKEKITAAEKKKIGELFCDISYIYQRDDTVKLKVFERENNVKLAALNINTSDCATFAELKN